MEFEFKCAFDHKEDMAQLYREYNELLLEADPTFEECLAMQNYDHEIEELEQKFAPPLNTLVIVYHKDTASACAGIKYFAPDICELKRMYVRPEFRGRGLGKLLCRMMMDYAREAGYSHMYLDTMPALDSAVKMYKAMGFREIEKYYPNPVENVIYMAYEL